MWGQGALDNTVGWGQGAVNNTVGWGSIYGASWSGDTELLGLVLLVKRLTDRTIADGGIVENSACANSSVDLTIDWFTYFRVIDDLGIVENINCLKI